MGGEAADKRPRVRAGEPIAIGTGGDCERRVLVVVGEDVCARASRQGTRRAVAAAASSPPAQKNEQYTLVIMTGLTGPEKDAGEEAESGE